MMLAILAAVYIILFILALIYLESCANTKRYEAINRDRAKLHGRRHPQALQNKTRDTAEIGRTR